MITDTKTSYKAETVTPLLTAMTHEIVRRSVFLSATLALVEVAVEETVSAETINNCPRTVYHVLSGSHGGWVVDPLLPARHDTAKILEVASAARLAWRGSERGWDDPDVR